MILAHTHTHTHTHTEPPIKLSVWKAFNLFLPLFYPYLGHFFEWPFLFNFSRGKKGRLPNEGRPIKAMELGSSVMR